METEETLPFPPPLVRRGTPTHLARAASARKTAARHTPARHTPALRELARGPAAPQRSALSLEQLTEARLAELREQRFLWETPPPLATAHEETPAQSSQQIVLASASPQQNSLVPLQWRGKPLSPEFQVYALRVARGEDLAPYRGPVLADSSLAFPWDAADVRALRKGTRRSLRSLFILGAFATLAAFVLPNLENSTPEPIATPAAVLSEPSLPTSTVPGPLVLESAALPSAALPPAALPPPALPVAAKPPALASAAPKARPPTLTPSPALPGAAASPNLAKRPTTDASKHATPTAAAAPPSGEATGPSPLLVDRPSF